MVSKPNTNHETLQAYDSIAPSYDQYSERRSAYLEAVDRIVIGNLTSNTRLLDLGAGNGRRLAKFIEVAGLKNSVAIEPSTEMAKICRQRTSSEVYQTTGEELSTLDIGQFDLITALWNVFGHIPNSHARETTIKSLAEKLTPNGQIILDVNNRHNMLSYGRMKVLARICVDYIYFDETRGDASFNWEIGDKKYKASGHLFIPAEIEQLIYSAGLKIQERYTVDYNTGAISKSKYRGQLLYLLKFP